MRLTRAAIERPFLTALITVALLFLGAYGWHRLPVDLNPRAELPNVIISVVFPGAGPGTVEELVAKPIEEAVRVVSGVESVFSVSQESYASFYVDLVDGADVTAALESCREAVGAIRGELPEGIHDPIFARLDINAQPVVFLGLIGHRSLDELRRLATDVLRPRIEAVKGVSSVEVLGGRERQVEVAVDRDKLLAAGLTMSALLEPLAASSRNLPGGRLRQGDRELGVRLLGEFESLDDIRNVPLPPPQTMPDLTRLARPPAHEPTRALRLGDVAVVRPIAADPDVRVRLQGREAVGLIISKTGRGNTVQVSRDARRAALTAPLPPGVEVIVARNTAATVREALADVNASIALGIILCAGTIYVFLRSLRGTLIVSTAIPVCLIGTFAPMAWGGFTLNQMTLLGLALSVGILVDDSIVCLEAIMYRLRQGEPAPLAAFNGRNDIALADTSTTLIDLAVFVPVAVMSGVVGQFFHDFGFVVAVAAALSLLAAYTVVPTMAARWYEGREALIEAEREPAWYGWLEARYAHVLRAALDRPVRTLAVGWGGLLLVALLAWRGLGVDFIPAADLSTILVNIELPAGSSADATERTVVAAERIVAAVPEVETLFTTLGRIETGFGVVNRVGPQYAQVNVSLRDRRGMLDRLLFRGRGLRTRSDEAVADDLREALRALPTVQQLQVIPVRGWGGAGAPIDFSLYGQDLDEMAAVGERIRARLADVPGLLNLDVSWRLGQPEVQVRLDRDRARELHVYPGALARELRTAIEGETGVTYRVGDDHLPVRVRLREHDRRNAADVARLPVGRSASRMITVADVATITQGAGPTRIDRRNGLRDLNFKAYLRAGVTLGEVRAEIEQALAELGLRRENGPELSANRHPTLTWGWRGDTETLAASAGSMAATALLGALLVYAIMAVLFNSAILPLTIMLSVPMAGAGALLALAVTGSSLSIVSGIGMILLISIVVRNAILLVDYALQLQARGVARRDAIEEAAARRLRPILMTTLTTILAMLPIALRIGKGAEIRAPMAIAVIGGLSLSTVLTLVLIPATYLLVDHWRDR